MLSGDDSVAGEGEAGDEQALADRDEHEQRGALGDVRTRDVPRADDRPPVAGDREAEHGADQLQPEGGAPRTAAAGAAAAGRP